MSLRIFRISNIFSWSVAIFLASVLFWVSQKVQRAEEALNAVNDKINLEIEAVRVLETEWDYLNSPGRPEEFAKSHLSIEKPKPEQVVEDISRIPQPENIVTPEAVPVHISVQKTQEKEKKPAVIQETDRENFNSLLEGLSNAEEGEE